MSKMNKNTTFLPSFSGLLTKWLRWKSYASGAKYFGSTLSEWRKSVWKEIFYLVGYKEIQRPTARNDSSWILNHLCLSQSFCFTFEVWNVHWPWQLEIWSNCQNDSRENPCKQITSQKCSQAFQVEIVSYGFIFAWIS
jgi:hypothetical protein